MNQFSKFVTPILTSALVFLLFSFALPAVRAQPVQSLPAALPTATALPGDIPGTVCDASRSIQVSGTAVVNVTPDRALIQLGVQSNGSSPQMVEAANSTATQAVIKAISAQGVAAKDIATDLYIIEPVYEDYDSLYIKGYRINNVIAITLLDVRKTSQVIAAALEAGANQVVNVSFYTSELRKYRDQAREMAIKAAQEKASALAAAAGAEAGCVLSIQENSWSYYNGGWYGSGQLQNRWTQNVAQNIAPNTASSQSSGDEPISLGQVSVRAEVSASFSLR